MTLMVFLGVVVSLLILRLIPGLLLRLLLAVPRQHVAATMRWVRARRIGVVSPRQSANVLTNASITSRRAPAVGRLKLAPRAVRSRCKTVHGVRRSTTALL